METEDAQSSSVLIGAFWMLGLTVVLFWLPVLGPLIAGYVGGRRSGSVAGAGIASIIPAVLATGLFMLFGAGLGFPLLDSLSEAGILIILLLEPIPLIGAAIVGAATASSTSLEDREA
jgi:uncharacterized membrane protein